MKIKRILITKEGRRFYVYAFGKDIHTEFGYIKAKDLKRKNGSRILTNKGKELFIFNPQWCDVYAKLKRAAQIILLKDIGTIIAETGVNCRSRIVDTGTGSGALACSLAHICKEVISYELRDDFIKIAEQNIKLLGLNNLKIKKKDVCKGIDERNIDLITLDLPEPQKALKSVARALKHGGWLVVYLPSMTQVSLFVKAVRNNNRFVYIKTLEVLQREWKIEGKIARPEHHMLGHTGFIVFVRRC